MTSPSPWPADLDPLVAAPAHQWPAAHYVLSWSPFVRHGDPLGPTHSRMSVRRRCMSSASR